MNKEEHLPNLEQERVKILNKNAEYKKKLVEKATAPNDFLRIIALELIELNRKIDTYDNRN